jgi:hypothetical protein
LYVATNAGLFYLSAQQQRRCIGNSRTGKANRQLQQIAWQNARRKAQQKKLNLKSIVQKLNPLKKNQEKPSKPQIVTVVIEANVYDYNYSNYIIEKIPYNFRKIAGIESKCKQLIPFQGRLIALTNTGLYEVIYGMANLIVEDRNLQYAEVSKIDPSILFVASNKGAFYLQKTAEGWSKPNYIASVQGICFSICQKDKILWLTGEGKIWTIGINSQGTPTTQIASYTIEANSTMRIIAREIEGNLLLFTPKTVFMHQKFLLGDAFLPAKNWLSYNLNATRVYFNQSSYTEFQYLLKGLDDSEWSAWRKQASIDFPYLPSGNYELHIRAKNAMGEISPTEVFAFSVKVPFWETWVLSHTNWRFI